jgi:hypothetical protein
MDEDCGPAMASPASPRAEAPVEALSYQQSEIYRKHHSAIIWPKKVSTVAALMSVLDSRFPVLMGSREQDTLWMNAIDVIHYPCDVFRF